MRRDTITPIECLPQDVRCRIVGAIAPAPEFEWAVLVDAAYLELSGDAPPFEPTDTVALAPGQAPTRVDLPDDFDCVMGMGSCVDMSTLGVLSGFTSSQHTGAFFDQGGRVRPLAIPDQPKIGGLDWALGWEHRVVEGVLEPSYYWQALVEPGEHVFAAGQISVVRQVDARRRVRLLDRRLPDRRGSQTLIGWEGGEGLDVITWDRSWTGRTMTDAVLIPGGRSGMGFWLVNSKGLVVSVGEGWLRDDPAGLLERLRDWDEGEGRWFWWRFAVAALGGPACILLAMLHAWWRARREGDDALARRDRALEAALALLVVWALIPLWGSLPALLEALR